MVKIKKLKIGLLIILSLLLIIQVHQVNQEKVEATPVISPRLKYREELIRILALDDLNHIEYESNADWESLRFSLSKENIPMMNYFSEMYDFTLSVDQKGGVEFVGTSAL